MKRVAEYVKESREMVYKYVCDLVIGGHRRLRKCTHKAHIKRIQMSYMADYNQHNTYLHPLILGKIQVHARRQVGRVVERKGAHALIQEWDTCSNNLSMPLNDTAVLSVSKKR